MTTRQIYLNGSIIPAEQGSVSLMDIGLLRGYAVFDLLRTVDGRPFLLAEHLQRLRASAAQLGLVVPLSDDEIAAVVDELLRRNSHAEATVRFLLTGGTSPDGMSFDPASPTFAIMTADLHEPPASLYETGGKLITHDHLREFPHAKTTNYVTKLAHAGEAEAAQAMDLLYCHDGLVLEAASASVFFVRDGRILAPKDHVLHGTTGALVLELARPHYEIVVGPVTLEEALEADEVFLTSTTRGVVPIVAIDGRPVGDGTPGPVVRDLVERFRGAAFGG